MKRIAIRGWFCLGVLAGALLASCGPGQESPDQTPVEESDPNALTWVAPTLDASIEVQDPVELSVYTLNPAVTVVHFLVDGAEVGVCDPTNEDTGDCLDPDAHTWRWTTQFAAAGHHTIVATFTGSDGAEVRASRELTVLEAGQAPLGDSAPESSPDEPDPTPPDQLVDEGTSQISQGITSARGYLDPSRDWHSQYGGIQWKTQGQRVLLRQGALNGSVSEVARCMARYGSSIRRYADLRYISRASVVATLIAESNCSDPSGSSDGLSSGPMQVTSSTCSAVTGLSYSECHRRMYASPDFSIDVGTRYMASGYQRRQHNNDPPKIAAAYNAGSIRYTSYNHWHMLSTGDHIDRWVSAYNAYRTWEGRTGSMTTASCPSGVYAIWTCNAAGTARERCIDGRVEREECACERRPSGEDDLCPASAAFNAHCPSGDRSVWTCEDGARVRCVNDAGHLALEREHCPTTCNSVSGGNDTCSGTGPGSCPAGTYSIWNCAGSARVRCRMDSHGIPMVETEECAHGCHVNPRGVDDTCNDVQDAPPPSGGSLACGHVQWWNSYITYEHISYGWHDTDLGVSGSTPVQLRHPSRLDHHGVYGWGYMPEFTDLVTGHRFRFLHLRPQHQYATEVGHVYPEGYVVGLSGGDTRDTGYGVYSTGAHLCVQTLVTWRSAFPEGHDTCH